MSCSPISHPVAEPVELAAAAAAPALVSSLCLCQSACALYHSPTDSVTHIHFCLRPLECAYSDWTFDGAGWSLSLSLSITLAAHSCPVTLGPYCCLPQLLNLSAEPVRIDPPDGVGLSLLCYLQQSGAENRGTRGFQSRIRSAEQGRMP